MCGQSVDGRSGARRLLSVVEAVPRKNRELHHHGGRADSQQLPSQFVLAEQVVFKKANRHDDCGDPSCAGRASPVFQKPLVNSHAQYLHADFSREKIWSTGHANSRASNSASARLGTYRPRSMEMMLCRETPTTSARCSWVHSRATRSSFTRF